MSSESEPQITADVSGEAVDERTLGILFDLHEETVLAFRNQIANRGSGRYGPSYMAFSSALTAEILFLEPALRGSQYYDDVTLGTLEHAGGVVEFRGLVSIVDSAEGVTITEEEQVPGLAGSRGLTEEVEKSVHIPPYILKSAFRVLQQWYDDVGLSTEFSEGNDEWEI
jgi:hypothetical protein